MAPIVHGLEAKYYGQITFYFLDADDPATKVYQRQYGFSVHPEFYLLDGQGNVVKKWFGFVKAEDFEAEFVKLLGQ